MSDFYNRDGSKFKGGIIAWAQKFEKEDRRVARDELPDGKVVSTVFLGMDHNFNPEGKPLIFETMVFSETGELDCDRYSTEEEAKAGHKEMVKKYLSKIRGKDDLVRS